MLTALFSRWTRTRFGARSTLDGNSSQADRPQRNAGDSLWQSLLRLIPGEATPAQPYPAAPQRQAVLINTMPAARAGFEACLHGVEGAPIEDLLRSIRRSRSLNDLWHLRTGIYTEVARAYSQREAEQRLALLSEFFQSEHAEPQGRSGRRH